MYIHTYIFRSYIFLGTSDAFFAIATTYDLEGNIPDYHTWLYMAARIGHSEASQRLEMIRLQHAPTPHIY